MSIQDYWFELTFDFYNYSFEYIKNVKLRDFQIEGILFTSKNCEQTISYFLRMNNRYLQDYKILRGVYEKKTKTFINKTKKNG